MRYDFDRLIDRDGGDSLKYGGRAARFGDPGVIPLWVADMDFVTAQPVVEALAARAAQGVFGYVPAKPENLFEAFSRWQAERRGWRPEPSRMSYCPGVVPALSALTALFSEEGEEILIQPPVYPEFASTIEAWGRRPLLSPLKMEGNGRYAMDFGDLARALKRRPAFFILCSPHNPVGRVWTAEELNETLRLCRENGVRVVSDEIHSDLLFRGHVHRPLAAWPEAGETLLATCLSASKTFNLAGLHSSVVVFARAEDQARFENWQRRLGAQHPNCFGLAAALAALNRGGEWLEQLLAYLEGNFQFLRDYCARHIAAVKPNLPEGSYLVWLDCRDLGLNGAELPRFMAEKAGLGLNDGRSFGPGGEGFMRLNAACPRATLKLALERLARAAAGL